MTKRFASLRPLRHRNFALLWSAALVSNAGSWMQTVAVGTLITQLTGKASAAGLLAAAGFLPVGLLSPVGGALADRVDRRRFLLWTTLGETGFATLLASLYATGHATPLTIGVAVFGGGCMVALGFPCYQAMLPDLVGTDDLLGAVSLSSAQFNLGRVIGPALAGLVVALGSYTWAFGLNAASFGATVVALFLVRVRSVAASSDGGHELWRRIAEGVREARAEAGCRSAIEFGSVIALTASPFIALIPAIAVVLFRGDASTTALLVTAQGVGAVTGALSLTPLAERFGRRRLLMANLVALPVALVLYASAPTLTLATVGLALVGATYIGVFSGLNVVIQLRAPATARARVLSLYFVAVGVIYPLGAAVQGRLADWMGLRLTTAAGGLALLVVVALVSVVRPSRLRSLDDPPSASAPPEAGRAA